MATTKQNTTSNSIVKFDVVDAIQNGIPNVELQITNNQVAMMADIQAKMTRANTFLHAKEQAFKKKVLKVNEEKKKLGFNDDRKLIKELKNTIRDLNISYGAIFESVLADFEPGMEFCDKLDTISKLAQKVR